MSDASRNDWRKAAEAGAAERFSLLRGGGATAADRQEIEAWRSRDPANEDAWQRIAAIWHGGAEAAADPQVIAMRESALARKPKPYLSQGWRPYALAASLVAVLGSTLWIAGPQMGPFTKAPPQIADGGTIPWKPAARTDLGQRVTITLADRSTVTVNTESAISTALSPTARRVRLDRGEALFKVAKDPGAPFTVSAGDVTVTALGTEFAVREAGPETVVTLVEGSVRVEARSSGVVQVLKPGTQLRARGGAFELADVNARAATSWTTGTLDFSQAPLQTVVGELNRYSARRIVLGDSALASVPVTGVFPTGDQDRFVGMLVASGRARVLRRTETAIELGSP